MLDGCAWSGGAGPVRLVMPVLVTYARYDRVSRRCLLVESLRLLRADLVHLEHPVRYVVAGLLNQLRDRVEERLHTSTDKRDTERERANEQTPTTTTHR